MFVITPHVGEVSALTLSPDGNLLASVGTDRYIKVWDTARLASAPPIWEKIGHERELNHAQFSPDGKVLFTCGTEGDLKAWNATNGEFLRETNSGVRRTLNSSINAFVLSLDGQQIAWGGNSFFSGAVDIVVAQTSDLTTTRRLVGHRGAIAIVAAHEGGWISGGVDRTIRFWDGATGSCVRTIRVADVVRGLSVSRDGSRLAGSAGALVKIWELPELGERRCVLPPGPGRERSLVGHTDRVDSIEFAADGKLLATTGLDGTIHVWDVPSGEAIRVFDPGLGPLHWVTFAPDGLTLAFSSHKGHVGLLDVDY